MSFYRTLVAAVAAMGLATVVMAADDASSQAMGQKMAADTTQATTTQTTETTTTTTETKVNVNTANAKELMKVKGLNRTKANAIIAYRKANGDFKSLDDLKSVKGFSKVSDKTMKKIQDQLTM